MDLKWVALPMVLLATMGCRKEEPSVVEEGNAPFELQLAPGMPYPPLRDDNPLTDASVRLGKMLFFEERISRTGTISCASCHHPDRSFSDTLPKSLGVDGMPGMRNAPPLIDLAYHQGYFRDGGVPTLELQVLAPVGDPLEMDNDINVVASALGQEEPYRTMSHLAYGRDMDAYVITRAIANYERTLLSGWSRYDRYLQGEADALTQQEAHGAEIFASDAAGCTHCHNGPDLSDHSYQNVGLYMDYEDPGRERITLDPNDLGKFKVPTLRNIALTAPYMHDGSMATLEQVVDFFIAGGVGHPDQSPWVHPLDLNATERADLLAFLHALTDERTLDQVP